MSYKIAINGFGRIGRKVYSLLVERRGMEVVAVNDLAPPATLAHLLLHDSAHGHSGIEVDVTEEGFKLLGEVAGDTRETRVLQCPRPAELPWRELGVDCVIECSGHFCTREGMALHLEAGAGRVLLSAPAKDDIDLTVVYGVNHEHLSDEHRLISAASCTTNCLAPVIKVLDEAFGIERGLMTTIHAYTNDQALLDSPHKDLRRARAAAVNIVPTTTGAAEAVRLVYPKMDGRLTGMACRVPVPCGSLVDLTFQSENDMTVAGINDAVATAAAGSLQGVLQYSTQPLVSQDIVENPHSSIFDSLITSTLGPRMAKVLSWYDNEWGYSNRVVDVAVALSAFSS